MVVLSCLALLVVFAGLGASAAMTACTADTDAVLCTDVPDGGCPLGEGLACTDPNCQAAYACTPGGVWVLDHVCPPTDAMIAEPVPPVITDAAGFDAPVGDLDCPELEMPDCSADLAASCSPACCGCEDLWVCQSGEWVAYGSCDANGIHPYGDGGGGQ